MNEEIEYAKMLEIPVSTVSVSEKKRRFKKSRNDLKEKLISKVNGTAEGETVAENGFSLAEKAACGDLCGNEENRGFAYMYAPQGEETPKAEEETCYSSFETVTIGREEDAGDFSKTARKSAREKIAARAIAAEFAAACILCAAIFMTNVFMPNSGMNTFFASLNKNEEPIAVKNYTDFTLTSVVNDFAEIPLNVSETGVLSFKGKCCVYPAADGTISSVTENENGTYDVKIGHSETFYGVICGLDNVYYAVGDKVYANIPVGYSNGEEEVQVTMYTGEEAITSFTVDEENRPVWVLS